MLARIIRIVLAVLILLTQIAPLSANDYVFSNGYYFLPGSSQAYTRELKWKWVNGYYNGCYYYNGYWQGYYVYSAVKLDVNAPDIEQKIIDLAKARDAAIFKVAQAQQKSQAALNLIDKLGLSGNFNVPNYGNGIFPYGGVNIGTQGQTVYGYQTLQLDVKGVDLNQAMQTYGQVVREAQQLGGQANAGLRDTIQQQSKQFADVAQTVATGQAASQLAQATGKAVNPPHSTLTQTTVTPQATATVTQTTATPTGIQGVSGVLSPSVADAQAFLKLQGPATCIACHSGNKLEGGTHFKNGFDIASFPTLSSADKAYVVSRMLTDDPKLVMPKNAPKLSWEVIQRDFK